MKVGIPCTTLSQLDLGLIYLELLLQYYTIQLARRLWIKLLVVFAPGQAHHSPHTMKKESCRYLYQHTVDILELHNDPKV